MSKLDPLPKPNYPSLKGWNELNEFIQKSFPKERTTKGKFGVNINLREYDLPRSEIISALENIDLVVSDRPNDNILAEEKYGN